MNRLGTLVGHISRICGKKHFSIGQRWSLLSTYLSIVTKRFFRTRVPFLFDYKHQTVAGFAMTLDRFESLYWTFIEIFVHEYYYFKRDELDTKPPVVLDCGGHIGLSVIYFKFLAPDATVIVFEPNPRSAAILRSNLERNNLKDVEVVQGGAGREEGEITIYLQSTGSTFFEDFAHRQVELKEYEAFGEEATAPIHRLSSFIHGPIAMLKLDVEGSEGDILAELNESGGIKHIRRIAMEYHQFAKDRNRLSDIAGILEDEGYDFIGSNDIFNPASMPSRAFKTFMLLAERPRA